MALPTRRAVAAAACLFLAAARPGQADTLVTPSAPPAALIPSTPTTSSTPSAPSVPPAALRPACHGPADAAPEADPPEFIRGCPPTPAQLALLHQSLEDEAPLGFTPKPRYELIIAGAASFGAVYLGTSGLTAIGNGIACIFEHHQAGCGSEKTLYIPVVGPLIHLAQSEAPGSCLFGPVLVVASLAQLTGLTLVVVGSVVRRSVPATASTRPRYSLAPYFSPTGGGMQALVRY